MFNVTLRPYIRERVYSDILYYVDEISELLEEVYDDWLEEGQINESQESQDNNNNSSQGALLDQSRKSQPRYGDPVSKYSSK